MINLKVGNYRDNITSSLGDNILMISNALAACKKHKSDAYVYYTGEAKETRDKIFAIMKDYEYTITDVVSTPPKNCIEIMKVDPESPYIEIDQEKIVPVLGLPEKYIAWNLTPSSKNPNRYTPNHYDKIKEYLKSQNLPLIEVSSKYTLAEAAYVLLKAKRYIGIDSGILHLNMMVGTPATIFCAAYEQGGRSKQIKAIHAKNLDVESIVLKAEELL